MGYTEKDFKEMQSREIERDGTFRFECQMCGHCCRKRSEPIIVTGTDVFRFSKALNMSVMESIKLNCEIYIGDTSHVPVCVLAEQMDGSCRLMRKGKCMVQENKPVVCALFPLGRFYDSEGNGYRYFRNPQVKCPGVRGEREWTLSEWLDKFHLEDDIEQVEQTEAWNRLLFGITQVTKKWDKRRLGKDADLVGLMIFVLYTNYVYDAPYRSQVESNMEIAKQYFKQRFDKKLEF